MKFYGLLTLIMCVCFLVLFGAVSFMQVPLLTDPQPWLGKAGALAAGVGCGLLIVDVLLPVPASLVMVAHGALFGVVTGTALSLLGTLGAAAFGFFLGRRGSPWIMNKISADERARVALLLRQWGLVAIVATRPVPILAETVAILAGTGPISWQRFLVASLLGNIPPSLLYALTGASARDFDSFVLIFGLVMVFAGLTWFLGKRFGEQALPLDVDQV